MKKAVTVSLLLDCILYHSFVSGQICTSPTPVGDWSDARKKRQADFTDSSDGVSFEDAKLACQVF